MLFIVDDSFAGFVDASTLPGTSPSRAPRLMTTTWYWPITVTPSVTP
jgi:hypothetical protein